MAHPSGASDTTSTSLIERVKAHDPEAWNRLVQLYGPLVCHWCSRSGLRSEDSADILQEVFRAVAGGIGSFRKGDEGGTFRGWLRGITHHKVADHFRRRGPEPDAAGGSDAHRRLQESPDLGHRDESSASDEASALFYRALELIRGEFEERTWQAFWRTVVDDDTPADIAADLGMSANAVYKAKARVLVRIREELGDLAD